MLAVPDVGGEQRLGCFQNREFPENLGRSWGRGSIGKAQRQLDRRHPTCSGTSFIGRGKSRLRRVGLGSQIRRWFPAGITFWNSAQSVGGSLPVENVVRIAMAAIAKPVVIAATIVATMPVTTSPVTVRNRIIASVVMTWAVVRSLVSGHRKRYADVQCHECLSLGGSNHSQTDQPKGCAFQAASLLYGNKITSNSQDNSLYNMSYRKEFQQSALMRLFIIVSS